MLRQQIWRFGCLLLIIVFTGCVEGGICPLGFVGLGRSCYYFSHQTASYWEASRACHHFKSHLAKITSKFEDDLIRNFALRHGKELNYWLGGSDLRVEGTWTWENPARRIGYSNWSPGQPDNNSGKEHCLEIRKPFGHYLWNDFQCQIPSHYICEKSMFIKCL